MHVSIVELKLSEKPAIYSQVPLIASIIPTMANGKVEPFKGNYFEKLFSSIFLTLFLTLLSSPLPLISKFAIDKVAQEGKAELLPLIIAVFAAFALSLVLISYLKDYLLLKAQRSIITDLQSELVGRVFSYPLSFFSTSQTGELLSRIRRDTEGLQVLFSHSLLVGITDVLRFLIGIVILFKLNAYLTAICLLPVPFFVANSLYFAKKYKSKTRQVMKQNAETERELSDLFMGIAQVKENAKETQARRKAEASLRKYMQLSISQSLLLYKNYGITTALSYAGEGLLLFFGIKQILAGSMTVGTLFAFQGYLFYLYGPSQRISSLALMLQHAKAAWERIKELLRVVPEKGGGRRLERIEEIEVRNLSFSYNGKTPLFTSLSFSLKRGEILLIKGPSGSGKTTLVKLLLGLYPVQEGEILYNGVALRELDLKWLRERVGFVSQDLFLFADTIERNIAFAKEEATREEIERAAALSGALEFIKKLPQGFSTKVGERGHLLSAGQRQRLSIARAILKEPEVIILDEAGSHLPAEVQREIETRVYHLFKDRIMLIISHRPIFLKPDKILDLEKMKVFQGVLYKETHENK